MSFRIYHRFFKIEALVKQIRAQAAEDMANLFAELQALREHIGAGKLAGIK